MPMLERAASAVAVVAVGTVLRAALVQAVEATRKRVRVAAAGTAHLEQAAQAVQLVERAVLLAVAAAAEQSAAPVVAVSALFNIISEVAT
jgi:hypothetical protein